MKVEYLYVNLEELDGSYRQTLLKSQDPGIVEMIQIQERSRCLDALDRLYPLVAKSRIHFILVELIGITPPRSTGVLHNVLKIPPGIWTLIMAP